MAMKSSWIKGTSNLHILNRPAKTSLKTGAFHAAVRNMIEHAKSFGDEDAVIRARRRARLIYRSMSLNAEQRILGRAA